AAQPGGSSTVGETKGTVAAASMPATPVTADPGALTPPRYPQGALAKHLGGEVVVQLRVGVDGNVKNVKVVSSKPAGVFDQVAIQAASKWQFKPGKDA